MLISVFKKINYKNIDKKTKFETDEYDFYSKYKIECEKYIKSKKSISKLQIICNNKMVSNIVGNKKENIIKIKEIYNILIEIKINNKFKNNKYKLKVRE